MGPFFCFPFIQSHLDTHAKHIIHYKAVNICISTYQNVVLKEGCRAAARICISDYSSCDFLGMFYLPHDICGGNKWLARRQTVAWNLKKKSTIKDKVTVSIQQALTLINTKKNVDVDFTFITQKLIFHRHISFDHRVCVLTLLQISLFAFVDSIIKKTYFQRGRGRWPHCLQIYFIQ